MANWPRQVQVVVSVTDQQDAAGAGISLNQQACGVSIPFAVKRKTFTLSQKKKNFYSRAPFRELERPGSKTSAWWIHYCVQDATKMQKSLWVILGQEKKQREGPEQFQFGPPLAESIQPISSAMHSPQQD